MSRLIKTFGSYQYFGNSIYEVRSEFFIRHISTLVAGCWYYGGVEARSRSGRRHTVAEAKMNGEIESDP